MKFYTNYLDIDGYISNKYQEGTDDNKNKAGPQALGDSSISSHAFI